jgi:hypothetical protein
MELIYDAIHYEWKWEYKVADWIGFNVGVEFSL